MKFMRVGLNEALIKVPRITRAKIFAKPLDKYKIIVYNEGTKKKGTD